MDSTIPKLHGSYSIAFFIKNGRIEDVLVEFEVVLGNRKKKKKVAAGKDYYKVVHYLPFLEVLSVTF